MFVGLMLLPPLAVKLWSVGTRFVKYYLGRSEFVRRGPPPPALRILGPFLVAITAALFASGFIALVSPNAFGGGAKQVHAACAYVWLVLILLHIAGHFGEIRRYSWRDLVVSRRITRQSSLRRIGVIAGSLVAGVVLAVSLMFLVDQYKQTTQPFAGVSSGVVHHQLSGGTRGTQREALSLSKGKQP